MPFINTASILTFVAGFVGLVVIFIGVGYILHARKSRLQEGGRIGGNIGIGFLIIAFGVICLGGMAVINAFQNAINTYVSVR
jgi:hypothetical protein